MRVSCPYCCGNGDIVNNEKEVYCFCLLCGYESEHFSKKFLGETEALKMAVKAWNEWIYDDVTGDV